MESKESESNTGFQSDQFIFNFDPIELRIFLIFKALYRETLLHDVLVLARCMLTPITTARRKEGGRPREILSPPTKRSQDTNDYRIPAV